MPIGDSCSAPPPALVSFSPGIRGVAPSDDIVDAAAARLSRTTFIVGPVGSIVVAAAAAGGTQTLPRAAIVDDAIASLLEIDVDIVDITPGRAGAACEPRDAFKASSSQSRTPTPSVPSLREAAGGRTPREDRRLGTSPRERRTDGEAAGREADDARESADMPT